jgi:cathepsin L
MFVLLGNMGCEGGSLRNTLHYLQLNGLMLASDYPYKARQALCRYIPTLAKVHVKSWAVLPTHDEEALKATLATVGPLPVSINASPHTFQFYHSGIYDDPDCPSDTVNHAMLLVGYTKDAWILKNWWTEKWGQKGYMYIKRNKNRCGISNFVAYITVYDY